MGCGTNTRATPPRRSSSREQEELCAFQPHHPAAKLISTVEFVGASQLSRCCSCPWVGDTGLSMAGAASHEIQ